MSDALAGEPVLLTPGPVSLSSRVAAALGRPVIFHRGADFHALHRSLVERLARLYDAPPSHDVLLLSGSGTMANEAMLSSTLGPTDEVLVLVNGQFAERLVEILRIIQVPHRTLAVPFGRAFDLADIERELAAPKLTAVVMVAMETSIGLVNPVRDVGRLCRARGKLLFVDAVSALGVERLSVAADGISFCASVANKGIGGPPGTSSVCADRALLAARRTTARRSWYLDLHRYVDFAQRHETPTTPPVPLLLALDVALDEMLAEGVERRHARCRALSALAIEAAATLGAQPLVSAGLAASRAAAVTTFVLPAGIAAAEVVDWFHDAGFVVHAVGVESGQAFQIAVMGAVSEEHLRRWAVAVDRFRAERAPGKPGTTAGSSPPSSASAAGTPRSRS